MGWQHQLSGFLPHTVINEDPENTQNCVSDEAVKNLTNNSPNIKKIPTGQNEWTLTHGTDSDYNSNKTKN